MENLTGPADNQAEQNGMRNPAVWIDIDGPVDHDRLRQAFEHTVAAHTILRGSAWEQHDTAPTEQQYRQLAASGADVCRGVLCVADSQHSALLVSMPPHSADPHSLIAFAREVARRYANQEPAPTLPFSKIAQWQKGLLTATDEHATEGQRFWQTSRDNSELVLPEENASGAAACTQVVSYRLSSATYAGVESLAQSAGTTSEAVLLAAWQTLIHRLTAECRFEIEVLSPGRDIEELQGAIGPVAKYLPVAARLDGHPTFLDAVHSASAALASAAEWHEYFDPTGSQSSSGAIAFEYVDVREPLKAADINFSVARADTDLGSSRIKLSVLNTAAETGLRWFYSERFSANTVQRWNSHFQTLLSSAVNNPSQAVSDLDLLTAAERHQLLVEWNRTEAPFPADHCFQQTFEAQTERTPESIAVRCNTETLTYRELNDQANRLAHHLVNQGVKPASTAAVCVERGTGMIVALLGILKAGAAYVPLDPENPKPRLEQQMQGHQCSRDNIRSARETALV